MAPRRRPDNEVRLIDHCVYCDNDGGAENLGAEHVIPLSFGGYWVLGRASCKRCAGETHAIEGQCCASMFKALRVHQKIRTRNPKTRPTHLRIFAAETPHNAPAEDVPVDAAPGFAPFPIFAPPQILSGIPPTTGIPLMGSVTCMTTTDGISRQQNLIAEGRAGALAYSEMRLDPFMRTLAKIAHCHVVGQVGLDGFTALLPPVILGSMGYLAWYIGGVGILPIILPTPDGNTEMHQIDHMTITIRGVNYIAVQIRLFSHLRPEQWHNPIPFTPVYLIIVGRYSGPKRRPHPVFI